MILDETKGRFNVNMNGKEYLNYRKYYDGKNKDFFRKFWKDIIGIFYAFKYFIFALLTYGFGRMLINTAFPTPYVPVEYGYFMVNSIVVPYLLVYLLAICVGFAWLIHGFGFIIVKR